jgi:lysophospholipase L1-like esterase
MKAWPVAMSLALLSACGGGGGGSETAPPLDALPMLSATTCASTGAVVKVQLFGDSTQKGYGLDTVGGKTPAAWLQADMDALFGDGAVTVESRAAAGTRLSQLLAGTDGQNLPWPGSVAADIVVVNHGINDAKYGTSLVDYRSMLEQLVRTSPAPVLLETSNPLAAIDMAPYAQQMREVATQRSTTLADVYAYVFALPLNGLPYLVDGVHPSEDLYGYIVRHALVPALMPLVKAKRCL